MATKKKDDEDYGWILLIKKLEPQELVCDYCHTKLEKDSLFCKLCGRATKKSRYIPGHVKREVYSRDNGQCVECGIKEDLEYDHIIPFSKGGSNTARNIQLLCKEFHINNNSKYKVNVCPDCNTELSVYNKCGFCGWEWKKCKWWDDKWKKCTWWGKRVELEFCRECKEYKPKEDVQEHKMHIHEEDIQKQEKRSRRISQRVKNEVWRRDKGRCVECGSRINLEYDHIVPFSNGGSNTARNIELLCQDCNRKKYNKI